jgi:hypothetical protein
MKKDIRKKVKSYPILKRSICEVLNGDIGEFSPIVQVGIAILLIAYHEGVTGYKEASTVIPYLESAELEFDGHTISKALEIISENNLISDGKINTVESEDINSTITWALFANLFDGFIERKISDGEARYKITKAGMKSVKSLVSNEPNNTNS